MEIRLADALKAGGETNRRHRRDAGSAPAAAAQLGLLGRPWRLGHPVLSGLARQPVRRLAGLRRLRSDGPNDEDGAAIHGRSDQQSGSGLATGAEDLLEPVFRLTADEAQFIIDRLIASQPAALLTCWRVRASMRSATYIWTHRSCRRFPRRTPARSTRRNFLGM